MPRTIIVGVGAGIAAYKSAQIVRDLLRAGDEVHVVPTPASLSFVGAETWSALSHHPVQTEVAAHAEAVEHIALAQRADLVVIAPATADLMARLRAGMADDLLTSIVLATAAPILLAPAMHTQMWSSRATSDNLTTLRQRGFHVVGPTSGALTGRDTGMGRMSEPADIVAAAHALLGPQDLKGRRVVVTAGGTHEPLDPVRFLGNRSSGRQGIALAEAARDRGADVLLLAAHLEVPPPAGVTLQQVSTARELADAALVAGPHADIFIMAAAVADFRPEHVAAGKIKKHEDVDVLDLHLIKNPDVLSSVAHAAHRPRVVVGFAAETASGSDLMSLAHGKLVRKGCDLIVANDVTEDVFGAASTRVRILDADHEIGAASGSKREVAEQVLNAVAALLPAGEENKDV